MPDPAPSVPPVPDGQFVCPEAAYHGKPFRYCPIKGCGWMETPVLPVPADHLRALVDEQAEDDGLWFDAQTANEACLQAALRRLHAEVERRPATAVPDGLADRLPEGRHPSDLGFVTADGSYLCDGCVGHGSFEHRCHRGDGAWKGAPACACPRCREVEAAFESPSPRPGMVSKSPDGFTDLVTFAVTVCRMCLEGLGGECHTPGCTFWMCPEPMDEQAAALRRCLPEGVPDGA